MRKQKLIKAASAVMATTLALGMVGCGSSNNKTTTEKKAGDEITKSGDGGKVDFSYWVSFDPTVGNKSYKDNLMWQELQKRTNTDIDFIHPAVGQENDQFKLLVSNPKELPDVIQITWSGYPGGVQKALDDKVIVPLNDYLDDMPNLKKILDENPEAKRQCSTDNGDIYGLPGFTNEKIRSYGALILREDWMKELNLKTPETIEDWDTVLEAFQKKGAKNPLGLNYAQLTSPYSVTFPAAFGVNNTYFLDDNGKVQFAPLTDGYKNFITKMHDWFEKDYFDPDFAALDAKMINAGVLNNQYGAVFGWFGSAINNFYSSTEDKNFKLECVSNPVEKSGDKHKFLCQYRTLVNPELACITSSCKDVAGVVKALDYMYSDEGKMLTNFGVEGKTYEIKDEKPVYTDLIMKNSDGLSMAQAQKKYTMAISNPIGITNMDEVLDVTYTMDETKKGLETANIDAEEAGKYALPPVTLTPDEEKQSSTINTEMDTYIQENLIAFINGSRPISEYDDFVNELKDMGADKVVEIQQTAVERYNNR